MPNRAYFLLRREAFFEKMGSGYSDLIKLRRFCEYCKQGYVSCKDRHKMLEAELEQELAAAETKEQEQLGAHVAGDLEDASAGNHHQSAQGRATAPDRTSQDELPTDDSHEKGDEKEGYAAAVSAPEPEPGDVAAVPAVEVLYFDSLGHRGTAHVNRLIKFLNYECQLRSIIPRA